MAYISGQYGEVLQEALTERDTQLQETQFPEIMIAEALPIDFNLDLALEYVEFGITNASGDVRDGLIGNKTNSLKTLDADVTFQKAPVAVWGKAETWSELEVQKIARLGIDVVKMKQDVLYANAMATIQYAGFLGHQEAKGQEGLLNGTSVPHGVDQTKTIAAMTAQEFIDFVLANYNRAWAASDYRIQPTHIAMDAADMITALGKFDTGGVIVGVDTLPLSAFDKILAALRKTSQNDNFNITFVRVPSMYARNIVNGKARLAVYTSDSNYLEMKVHNPEVLQVRQRDLLTYESGYLSGFTGALWKQPKSAVYADYAVTPATP
jgi:Uncharacterized protein conserved in bacteria (DUF2184).